MNKYIIVLLIFLFGAHSAYSATEEYTFILEFDHDFEENEDIECEIIYDDRDKTLDFDEDSDDDYFIYENEFETTFENICDDEIDEIDVEIIDENDIRIDRFDYDDTCCCSYNRHTC